jgi:hypothetical protein
MPGRYASPRFVERSGDRGSGSGVRALKCEPRSSNPEPPRAMLASRPGMEKKR